MIYNFSLNMVTLDKLIHIIMYTERKQTLTLKCVKQNDIAALYVKLSNMGPVQKQTNFE